ncbi:nucleotide exchange factor GrpE [Paludisphaera mucosa]|uniref:Nucleotide exchange factor GrpE n=1 Tax=Paludisphaera mucosa TaxID=3030827 RepID=A0ABT6FB95_9BACT|nr:nucleotide exchange factor GrpE [Paludisphaera mucosa]MDG3004714.1 nucleotide exchange factor GrpE [Paludisphaera mucosa]
MSPDTEDRDGPAPEIEAEAPYETPTAEPEIEPAPASDYVETERAIAVEEEAGPAEPEAGPAAEPPPFAAFAEEVREAFARLGDQVHQKLAGLQAQFDREVRAEANRERIVDRLHAELQEYKQDLVLKVQRPIFVDLIQLHDDVGKMAHAVAPEAEAFRGTLESIQTALEDVLYRQGVEPFRAEGDAFDPRRQRAVTTVPTADPALAKTIAARIRPGFQSGDKVIRPEVVSVYTLQA